MRSTTLIHRTMNLLIASFFVMIGVMALIVPWVAHLRRMAIDKLLENAWSMTAIGLGLIVVGALMILNAANKKRNYYHLKTGDRSVQVDESLIMGYLNEYWEMAFPGQEVSCDLTIKSNTLHVIADLPPLPFDEQRPFLKKVESDLGELFSDILDYHKSFSLSVSFQEAPELYSHN